MARSFAFLIPSLPALALLACSAVPAVAATTTLHLDSASFEADCKLAGGTYRVMADGRLSCGEANCDGAGGNCVVVCDGDACTAETPHVLKGEISIHSILRDGKRLRPAPQMPGNFWGDPKEPAFEIK